ncbi:MAG: hypothetical protein HZA89_17410 [Verrucomicrobia bacterium]|nr:hypothetical protein [Verrucomicrobiota bacterium]
MNTAQTSGSASGSKRPRPALPCSRVASLCGLFAAVLLAFTPLVDAAPVVRFQTIHSFGDSTVALRDCRAPLLQASDGRLYGTTTVGGNFGNGTLFAVNTDGTGFTILWNFLNSFSGGAPEAALIEGSDGRLYGTTPAGGAHGGGALFWLLKDGSDFGVLVHFDANSGTASKSALVEASDGKLYGTASAGGVNGQGTLFSVNKDGSELAILHSFDGANDGGTPLGTPVEGADGAFYGTASTGGVNDGGTVFRLTPDGNEFTVLRALDAAPDGGNPAAGLLKASDGMLYGTAQLGGASGGGTLFRLMEDGAEFAVLHSLDGAGDGGAPAAKLIEGGDGALYGTASAGGGAGQGTIFRIDRDGSNFAVIRSPDIAGDGGGVVAGVIEGGDGALYGATGVADIAPGLLFKMDKDGNGFTPLWRFISADGRNAAATPAEGGDGVLYGTTLAGGDAGLGTIFRVNKDGGSYTVLRALDAAAGTSPNALLAAGDGALYGTASGDGANGWGTLFKINRDGSGFTVLRNLDFDNDGGNPAAALIEGGDGALYGTTTTGGAHSSGTVFKMNKDGTGFSVLHALDGGSDGANPGALLEAGDGKLYGTARDGGTNGLGTVFGMNKDGAEFTVLYTFEGADDGANPAALLDGPGGALYGTTPEGGVNLSGTVFRVNKDGSGFTTLWSLDGTGEGGAPRSLANGPGGMIYGTAKNGGEFDGGTVFKLNPAGGGFTVLWSFNAFLDGGHPDAGLRLGMDGVFYGATYDGTVEDAGSLFWIIENRAPVAVAGGPYSAEVGEGFTLNAAGSTEPDSAFGDTIVSYQWDLNNDGTFDTAGASPVTNITASFFAAFGPVFPGTRIVTLRVVDNNGAAATASASLVLRPAITFATQPQSLAVSNGATALFYASVSSSKPITYQWRRSGTNLLGETNEIYFIPAVTRALAGAYSVTVSNSVSAITSTNAQLRVLMTQKLKSPVKLANGSFQVLFSDSDGTALTAGDVTNFVVQASTNLAATTTTNWVTITNGFIFTNGAVQFLDTNAPALPRRFYRVISK